MNTDIHIFVIIGWKASCLTTKYNTSYDRGFFHSNSSRDKTPKGKKTSNNYNQRRQQEQSNKVVEDILMKITNNAIQTIVYKKIPSA